MAGRKHPVLRRILKVLLILFLLLLLACIALYLYMDHHSKSYDINFYQLTSEKLNENLRIALITDLHLREYGENNDTLVADIAALKPQLILLVGDMVIYPNPDYESMLRLCGRLTELAPVYAVSGNHESELMYLAGDKQLIDRFTEQGVTFLENKDITLELGENTIQLVGLNGGFEKYGGREEMERLDPDTDVYRIVMDHFPYTVAKSVTEYSFDLAVSGHVHGGIVCLPKLGGLYSAEEGFLPEYTKGSYALSNGATMILSAGMGDSFALPLRFNNDPELVIIDINWY